MDIATHHRAQVFGITAIATERWQQNGDTRVMLHHPFPQDLVQVRPLISAIPPGDGHDLCLRFFITVIAPIDRNAGALEMGKAGCKAQTFGRVSGDETVECGHARGIEGVQGATEGVIMELFGTSAG
jgi:hypothetical protein